MYTLSVVIVTSHSSRTSSISLKKTYYKITCITPFIAYLVTSIEEAPALKKSV